MERTLKASRRGIGLALVLLIFLIIPLLDRNDYHLDVLVNAGIFAILAIGLNVMTGYCGLLNLGYAAFFAVGAYTYGLLNVYFNWPFWLCLPICLISSTVFGLILGCCVLRLRGDYLALVTLGFGEITRISLNNLDSLTGGPNGLNVSHPVIGGILMRKFDFGIRSWPYYYLILLSVAVTIIIVVRLSRCRLGRAWLAIKEDEVAAACMGIPTGKLKLLAFCIGSAIAGFAGWLFAGKQGFVSPDSFDFITSIMLAAMLVLGGMGSVAGALVGAVVLTVIPEVLRPLQQYRMFLFGAVMILMMLFRPQGLLGGMRVFEEFRPETERIRDEEDEVLAEDLRQ
ncbi:MAG: branched-chain amino acid ABC transporter permease [Candidatus Omnitrophota bacterium]